MKRGKGGYEMTRKILEIQATVFLFAGVVAILYVWTASPLGTSDRVGITMAISTVALVIVTGIYAWHTRKMVEEMREQRYDAVRAIRDFQWQDSSSSINGGALMEGGEGRVPPELYCKLCNIGAGPAIDLYSFTKVGRDNRHRYDFGTLKAGGLTRGVLLSVSQEGSIGVIEARYRDIYDRDFTSKLEVYPVKGQGLQTKLRVE